jgi:hypothetical protein
MNEYNVNRSLQLLVGELLYKNQLLREAVASKDQTVDLIINHLLTATVSACSCGVGGQLVSIRDTVKLRELEFARRRNCCLGELGDAVPQESKDFLNVIPNKETSPCRKVEVDDCDFCGS